MSKEQPSAMDVSGARIVNHFGERVRPGKYGYHLTRDAYALPSKSPSIRVRRDMFSASGWAEWAWMYEDEEHTVLSDEYCERQRDAALENFDLNMAFFAQIESSAFEQAIARLRRGFRSLRPVNRLSRLDGVEGVYVMVLDGYHQAYIGQASDMRARIRKHWSGVKQFDRLLWGHKHESVLSIDSFRALDTTRIFAARTSDTFSVEAGLVESFCSDYLLNRIGGGELTGMRSFFITNEIKRRNLTDTTGS